MFDFNDPFFRPLWRRVAVLVVAFGWGLFEFVTGAPFWGVLFCALGAAAYWGLFVTFNPRENSKEKDRESTNG